MYYIDLLLLIILITLLCIIFKIDIKKNKKYLLFMFILLTIFLGIRGSNVGPDMENYKDFFINSRYYSFSYLLKNIKFELGFKYFTKIISLFTSHFRVYVFIISVLSMFGIYDYIKNNSKNYFSSIFLFITFNYFIYYFCTLRQVLAISIFLYSVKFLKKNQLLKYILCVLLASLFHKTAIILLALCLIKYIPSIKKYLKFYLIGCLLLLIFKNQLVSLFTLLFYQKYIGYRDMSGSGYKMLILVSSFIVYFCIIDRKYNIDSKDNKLFIYMLLLSLPFQILSTTQGLLARVVLYFNYSLLILIPNYLESKCMKKFCIIKMLYYILLFTFFVIQVKCNSMYVPYTIF